MRTRCNERTSEILSANDIQMKIAILGLGAVGGFIGGKLALYYQGTDKKIIFITRGENMKAIKLNGLKLVSVSGEEVSSPYLITDNPAEIGYLDLLICCIKSYDLEESITSLYSCITEKTIIIPLLNGVDAPGRIRSIVPQADVLEGCIYIVSQLIAPGVIKQAGNLNKVYFGSNTADSGTLSKIETLFRDANINANASQDISVLIWEKFFFISPLATLTSYLNIPVGEILSNENFKTRLVTLMQELKLVVDAKNIKLPENIILKALERLYALPYETTSSMQKDFHRRHKTEVQSLTGIVSELGRQKGIATPLYDLMLESLKTKVNKDN